MIYKIIIWVVLLTFNCSLVSPLQAQILPSAEVNLAVAPVFNPALIKGMTIHPEDPLTFDFIIHPGDKNLQADQFKKESQKLIKYFLASLTVPEKEMWVNLSPMEKDRIIPDEFGRTEMGRDLLMQDYFLKQLTASLISPDNETGKKMWDKIYAQVQAQYGTTDIPVDVLSKVWIVPQSARIYENGQSVFVVDAHLKVLMEEEYLSGTRYEGYGTKENVKEQNRTTYLVPLTTQIIKDILIPAIEREVNNGPTFANLRQIYNSVILAAWYKKNLKQSLLGQVYVDRGRTNGVSHNDPKAKEEIYNRYLEAFRKGADSMKEEYDPATQEVVIRKYISGGMNLARLEEKVQGVMELPELEGSNNVRVKLEGVGRGKDTASPGSDTAMTAQSKENELINIIKKNIDGNGEITLRNLAIESGFDNPNNKRFQTALLKHFRTAYKTIIHEHVSGVIFPENLLKYFLDDEPSSEEFSSEEELNRKKARQEARRRFVLTVTSPKSGIELQANPVNPDDIDQADADRAFKEILGLPRDIFLVSSVLDLPEAVKKLKTFTTYKDRDVDWNKFERTFAVIKTATDSHPRFRYELLRKGVLRHFTQDNVNNLELTDFHGQSLGELIKELVSIEDEVGGEITLSVLKAFRKDYLERILTRAEKDAEYRQQVFKPYQGRSLEEVSTMILNETIAMDERYFKLDKERIKKEFEEAVKQVTENLKLEKEEQVTTEDIRNRLIYAFQARKLALKEAKDLEVDLNQLELQYPLLRKRVGGISSVGIETGYINWIGSPILRNARRIGLKISSHMGEVWEPGQYLMSLMRIKSEIEIGVNRLAHVTVLGLDYSPSTRISISEPERIEAQKLQEEIFTLIRRNNIHVELQPTSQIITSADFNEYKDHIISKFFKMNEDGKKISFSINTDDSSIFDVSPSEEELAIWQVNPDIPYITFSRMRVMANNARFYESPRRVKRRLKMERWEVLQAVKGFERSAIVVFGSARIPDGGTQEKIGRKVGELAWENQIAVRTGGGPSAMKWPLSEFINFREKHFSRLRKLGLPIPETFPVQSIRVLLNTFEPNNEYLEQNYNFRHFVYRKLGLYSNSRGFIALHGGLGTWDEIFEAWRRGRRISTIGKEFYQPVFDVLRDRWTAAGLIDRINYWPFVTDVPEEAVNHILSDKSKIINPTQQQTQRAVKEMERGIDKLSRLPRVVVILGKPENNAYGQKLLSELNNVIAPILKMDIHVRVASRGLVLDSVFQQAQQLGAVSNFQAVLNRKEGNAELSGTERYLQDNLKERSLILEDDSNHQLLLTYDARGYIVLPGGIGTMNKFFDLVVATQTKSIRRKPIVLVGRDFWEPILKVLKSTLENYPTGRLISPGDLELMRIVDTPEEAMEELALNGTGENPNAAMMAEGFANKSTVLVEAPGQIRETLEAQGILQAWEIDLAKNLIEEHGAIYEALGLTKYNYHDFVHSLIVTHVMTLNLQADQHLTDRDWKVGFLAALFHDFHIRHKDKKDNPKQGTIAYVPETIRQIKRILNIPNGDAVPQEELFKTFLNDPVQGVSLQQLALNMRELMGEDFNGMMNEVLALILRTHNAYNVAPAPAEYLKKGKAIRATIETDINAGTIKMTDIEKYVKREYKKMLVEVDAKNEMNTDQKKIAKTWLEQQQIVELAYLDTLNKVKKEQEHQVKINRLANILERVADKGGNYLVDSPDMIEKEIVPGLIGEVPAIKLIENYNGFVKNELLNEEVLQLISPLPGETKRLFMRNIRHFAAIAGELDEWDTQLSLQVEKTLFPKGDAAQMAAPIIEEVLKDPLIDQGRAVGKALGLPENLIPPGIRFIKADWSKVGTTKGTEELARVVTYRLLHGKLPQEINIYYGDTMKEMDVIHDFGHYINLFLDDDHLIEFSKLAINQILNAESGTLPYAYTSERYQPALQYLSAIRTNPEKLVGKDNSDAHQAALNMIGDEWARGLGYYLGQLIRSDRHQAATERFKIYQDHYRRLGIVQPVGWESGVTIDPDTEKLVQKQKEREKRKSSTPPTAPDAAATVEAPGGIDLNPDHIQFDQQGQKVDFNLPSNDTLIQEYWPIEGFEPVIINITPVTNIPLLLGTAKPMSEKPVLTKI